MARILPFATYRPRVLYIGPAAIARMRCARGWRSFRQMRLVSQQLAWTAHASAQWHIDTDAHFALGQGISQMGPLRISTWNRKGPGRPPDRRSALSSRRALGAAAQSATTHPAPAI